MKEFPEEEFLEWQPHATNDELSAARWMFEHMKAGDAEYHREVIRSTQALSYIQGIVERGEGRKLAGDEPLEPAILNFVKRLESDLARLRAENEALREVVEYYADSTNFEAVDVGRNYISEFVVEEYNKITVSGDEMGSAARAVLEKLKKEGGG